VFPHTGGSETNKFGYVEFEGVAGVPVLHIAPTTS